MKVYTFMEVLILIIFKKSETYVIKTKIFYNVHYYDFNKVNFFRFLLQKFPDCFTMFNALWSLHPVNTEKGYTPLQLCAEKYEPQYLTPKENAEQ
jgi:hypothetical protein